MSAPVSRDAVQWPSQDPSYAEKPTRTVVHFVDFGKAQELEYDNIKLGREAESNKLVFTLLSVVTGIAAVAIAAYTYQLGLQTLTRQQKIMYGGGTAVVTLISIHFKNEANHFAKRADRIFRSLWQHTPPQYSVDKGNLVGVKA